MVSGHLIWTLQTLWLNCVIMSNWSMECFLPHNSVTHDKLIHLLFGCEILRSKRDLN